MRSASIMHKSRIFAAFVVFSVVFGTPFAALAASSSSSSRYFMANTSAVWKNVLGARHVFDDGFTADLSAFQLRVAKFAGLKPIPVKNFNILADDALPSATPTPQVEPTQGVPWGIRTMLNDDTLKSTSGGAGVTIAILDTGIDREHPDLKSRIDGCYDYTDLTKGFVDGSCDDLNGHGTHMAGIIAADGGPNGDGIYGFAPQASISVYKTCNSIGNCMSDDIAVAMRAAVDNGAQIIVLGFGGESVSSFIDDAIAYAQEKGVLVIAAAGNDGPYDDSIDWPARNPAVMSVGALDSDLVPADFSSRGVNTTTKPYHMDAGDIEFAAPGVNVESTFRGGGYAIMSGTSMAAASLAGMTARLWQSGAEQPAEATRFLLHEISEDIAPKGDDNATGFGMPRTIIQ